MLWTLESIGRRVQRCGRTRAGTQRRFEPERELVGDSGDVTGNEMEDVVAKMDCGYIEGICVP